MNINLEKILWKYAPTENVTTTMAEYTNKTWTTVTLAESRSDEVLPMQLIYKGKTNRSLPAVEFPASSVWTSNKNTGAMKRKH